MRRELVKEVHQCHITHGVGSPNHKEMMRVCEKESERKIESFLAPNQQSPSKSQPVSVCSRRSRDGRGVVFDSLLMQECSHHHHHHCRRCFSFVFICFQKFSAFYFILSSHFVISCCQPSTRIFKQPFYYLCE